MLFRQIRLITGDNDKFNQYLIFVDCKGAQNKDKREELRNLFYNGFFLNGKHFEISERSSSMVRYQTLSFVDSDIAEELNKRVSMDIKINKTVLSKYYAYRGLLLSSCHHIEYWYPEIVIVPDYFRTIKDQKIKYAYDSIVDFIDKKTGEPRKWKQKDIAEKTCDIEINVFDGCGIHHPDISAFLENHLQTKGRMTSILWRAPFIKGVTHEIDYTRFFEERNIFEIYDIWNVAHSIYDPMIIMTESMYKGSKYFKDWQEYWDKFKKYDHCIGVSKWNFSLEEEPVYTRANYQILQDLEIDYDDFRSLADDTINWIEKIISGDKLYTHCFLGLFANKCKSLNNYTRSILKNPEMLKEHGVRNYFVSLVKKHMEEMHTGKLYIKACNKFIAPDLIMFLEHIGQLDNIEGCLNSDEFYSVGYTNGKEYLIERNPHICKSEHTILKSANNELLEKYCGHLSNVCMVNGKSITMPRLNGGDYPLKLKVQPRSNVGVCTV